MAILKFTSGSTHTCYSRLCKYLESALSPSCLLLLTWAFDCFEGLCLPHLHRPSPWMRIHVGSFYSILFRGASSILPHPQPGLKPRVDAAEGQEGPSIPFTHPSSRGVSALSTFYNRKTKWLPLYSKPQFRGSRNKPAAT